MLGNAVVRQALNATVKRGGQQMLNDEGDMACCLVATNGKELSTGLHDHSERQAYATGARRLGIAANGDEINREMILKESAFGRQSATVASRRTQTSKEELRGPNNPCKSVISRSETPMRYDMCSVKP
ncbi:hypothetical protein PM082_002655 [Marasmius tenuissimus]|nr:hypothetical protein PM082_002655 [Marasmius tenuissimus]